MLEAALALCGSFSSSVPVGGGALSGPGRGQWVLWEKRVEGSLGERECLKGREGAVRCPA